MTLRAFLAVPVGDEARRTAARAADAMARTPRGRGVSWVRPENYHVTLRFLGETEEERIAPLAAAVARTVAGCAPFALQLGAVHAFPSPRRPRVVAVALEPEAPLCALAERVEAAVREVGLGTEERRFRAHLTLGRVRDRVHPRLPAEPLAAPPFPVTEVVLFRSERRSDGARHEPLERMPLGGPDRETRKPENPEGEVHGEERPFPRAPL